MSSVKPDYPEDEAHATLLMGLMFRQVSAAFEGGDWHGLRQSHFRVIASVPPQGISVTDLAQRVGMTKQGCGQFVTFLAESGHLRVMVDRTDRRVRLVRRTPKGNRTNAEVTARMLEIEADWAATVGERRYRTFRRVLAELAQPQG
jgi:DNA-binding MarR family transcriptional regulator